MKLLRLFLFAIIFNVTLLYSNSMNYYTVTAGWLDDIKHGICKLFNSEVTEKWEGDDPEIKQLMEKEENKKYYIDSEKKTPYREKKTTKDLNCSPPWNRYTGRTGCLLKYPVNDLGLTFSKEKYCAEAINDNASNEAKIRARIQLCNAFACWVKDDILTHGKCNLFVGSWGVNPVRLCARIAYPDMTQGTVVDAKDDINDDKHCIHQKDDEPGYTRCIHVDEQGRQRVDRLIEVQSKKTNEKKKIRILAPKLCLYNDPWLYSPKMLSLLSPLTTGIAIATGNLLKDPYDWNPNYQLEHQHQYKFIKSPAYIKALMEQRGGRQLSDEEVAKLIVNKSEAKKFNLNAGPVLSFIMGIINTISTFVKNIDEHYNNIVEPEILGCVELPLGVSPPPFYDTLDPDSYKSDIKVQQICTLNQIKNIDSTTNNYKSAECVMSDTRNNVIHNSVRVTENNLLPVCPSDNSEKTNAKFRAGECVQIRVPGFNDALNIHENLKDNIPLCNKSESNNTPCVIYNNPNPDLSSSNFIVLYTTIVANDEGGYSTSPQSFNYCIPLCGSSLMKCPAQSSKLLDSSYKKDCCNKFKSVCQKIWGVNAGSYKDVELDFTKAPVQNSDDKVLFNEFDFQGKKLMALITRQHIDIKPEFFSNPNSTPSTKINTILHKQKPEEICVYDVTNKHKLIGCVLRAERPIPKVKACQQNPGNHFKPNISIWLAAKDDKNNDVDILEGCVEAQNIHHNNTKIRGSINLAGYDYSAYVTDAYDSIIDERLTGGKNASGTERLGKYYNTKGQAADSNPIYQGGLEIINDAYVSGGKLICVDSNNIGYSCDPKGSELQKSLCVLSKKITHNTHESLSYAVENREDPKFDKQQCMPENKNYPGCLKLDKNNYYKLPDSELDDNAKQALKRIRTKNSLELGLCIKIPEMPDCKGFTEKYTIWSDAKVGEESIGKCKPSDSRYDYIASPNEQALRRLCYFDPAQSNSDIHFTTGNSATPVLGSVKAECKQVERICKVEEINGVIWPEAKPGESAKPRCTNSLYQITSNDDLTRKCIFDPKDNQYKFEKTPDIVTKQELCKLPICQAEEINGVIWPETKAGEYATPKCTHADHKIISNADLTRKCIFDSNYNQYKLDKIPNIVMKEGLCVKKNPFIVVPPVDNFSVEVVSHFAHVNFTSKTQPNKINFTFYVDRNIPEYDDNSIHIGFTRNCSEINSILVNGEHVFPLENHDKCLTWPQAIIGIARQVYIVVIKLDLKNSKSNTITISFKNKFTIDDVVFMGLNK